MTKNNQLLGRLREIASGPGELDARVQASVAAIQAERARFPVSDAGRIQWNWYMGQLSTDIRFECDRLAMSARKKAKPGEPAAGPMLELFGGLQPRILGLKESTDQPISLATAAETGLAVTEPSDSSFYG
jgi:hypothetical protein